jgi:ATP-dependent DNA helicase RecQ
MIKKYTANYVYTNPNFVIQNLVEGSVAQDLNQVLCVLKNLLQRGFPTTLSKFLQQKIGAIHKEDNFQERFLFASNKSQKWYDTIKGDAVNNYYPALEFYENIIPNDFGEYAFIQSLIIPEIEINALVGEENTNFINQQVDFFIPIAKLIIEIDGQQHKTANVQRVQDSIRDGYLTQKGFTTIRINTSDLRDGKYLNKVKLITDHLSRFENILNYYRETYQKLKNNNVTDIEKTTKLLPTAIIRFQILLIELFLNNYINLEKENKIHLLSNENIGSYAELAIEDLLIWLDKLWLLKNKKPFPKTKISIIEVFNDNDFIPSTKTNNVDFSLFERFTDKASLNNDILYVRTDYFDVIRERNHFRVSTTEPINYKITEEDKDVLEFFLQNIFDKEHFREGQFPIISNALNRRDTIGLLPTGGGKSLCYQLPCLLQPAINFVVCPIKSLMYDQNENLENMLITNIAFITSDLDAQERRKRELGFEKGHYLFVFISPEKFQIPSFREKITAILASFSMAYAVIDEVHCLSEWGHDFRTSYLNLAKTIDKLSPRDSDGEGIIKFIGLTATASVNVLKDIKIEFSRQKQKLADDDIKSLLDYSRAELNFHVKESPNKNQVLVTLLKELADNEHLTETEEKAAIIFTPNVNGNFGCYAISNQLNTIFPGKSNWYSGDVPRVHEYDNKGNRTGRKIPVLKPDEFITHKTKVQLDYKKNKYSVLVATKAFGMGIDKSNIHYSIHYGLPSSVEALYQEAGRAGRWDKLKEENKGKKGHCYVLYSPESMNNDRVQRLFNKDTTFAEMRQINEEAGWNGKDVFKQLFLFLQGQKDIQEDFKIIIGVIKNYFKPNQTVRIFWNDASKKLGIQNDTLQKAIYRLSLLGIVSDWTTDFINHFEVEFNSIKDESLLPHLSGYINKYEPDRDVVKDITLINEKSLIEKSIWFLLNWIFENIAYNRKQSLKTLVDWSDDFKDSATFKRRIDNYFKFTESTFILQHISEKPLDYVQWFEAFKIVERNVQNEIVNTIYLPSVKNEETRIIYFENLRDSLSRSLEGARNNVGLNLISGLVRLFLNDYSDLDGKNRFESALNSVKNNNFDIASQNEIIENIKEIGNYLSADNQYALSQSITIYYPEKLEELADYYGLLDLLNNAYLEKVKKLNNITSRLYEQLEKI